MNENQANEETALLLRNGIPASRDVDPKTGKMIVWVEQNRFADAVDLLRAHGLPKPHYDSIADVFKGNGLIVSPAEDRARMIYALDEELSRTISDIDGVLSARVNIVVPDNDPLLQNVPPGSASVVVRYRQGSPVGSLLPQIKMLVAGGVAGLSYDKVDVILLPAAVAQSTTQPMDMEAVYGIWVYRGSAQAVRLLLAAAAFMLVSLAGIGAHLAWQFRRKLVPWPSGGNKLVPR